MSNTTTVSDLAEHRIVIYCAGASGRQIYSLLTRKAKNVVVNAFCDTFKSGYDKNTGLEIIKPEKVCDYSDAFFIVGLSDYLKLEDVLEIEKTLTSAGIKPERILRHSHILSMFRDLDSIEFDWQHSTDNVYDFETNVVLIESLSHCIGPGDSSVVDLGAGNMSLARYLPPSTSYYPVDYKRRNEDTVVCDFNKKEFPDIYADVYVLCAMLYYVECPFWLLEKCAQYAEKKIIIALNSKSMAEYPEVMHVHGFKNYVFFDEIKLLLGKYGFIPSSDITIESVTRRFVVYEKTGEHSGI